MAKRSTALLISPLTLMTVRDLRLPAGGGARRGIVRLRLTVCPGRRLPVPRGSVPVLLCPRLVAMSIEQVRNLLVTSGGLAMAVRGPSMRCGRSLSRRCDRLARSGKVVAGDRGLLRQLVAAVVQFPGALGGVLSRFPCGGSPLLAHWLPFMPPKVAPCDQEGQSRSTAGQDSGGRTWWAVRSSATRGSCQPRFPRRR